MPDLIDIHTITIRKDNAGAWTGQAFDEFFLEIMRIDHAAGPLEATAAMMEACDDVRTIMAALQEPAKTTCPPRKRRRPAEQR